MFTEVVLHRALAGLLFIVYTELWLCVSKFYLCPIKVLQTLEQLLLYILDNFQI